MLLPIMMPPISEPNAKQSLFANLSEQDNRPVNCPALLMFNYNYYKLYYSFKCLNSDRIWLWRRRNGWARNRGWSLGSVFGAWSAASVHARWFQNTVPQLRNKLLIKDHAHSSWPMCHKGCFTQNMIMIITIIVWLINLFWMRLCGRSGQHPGLRKYWLSKLKPLCGKPWSSVFKRWRLRLFRAFFSPPAMKNEV